MPRAAAAPDAKAAVSEEFVVLGGRSRPPFLHDRRPDAGRIDRGFRFAQDAGSIPLAAAACVNAPIAGPTRHRRS